jgi:hypothetical protein
LGRRIEVIEFWSEWPFIYLMEARSLLLKSLPLQGLRRFTLALCRLVGYDSIIGTRSSGIESRMV